MIEFKIIDVLNKGKPDEITILNIIDEEVIGSIEILYFHSKHQVYIENIFLSGKFRGKGYLRKIVYKLREDFTTNNGYPPEIFCLPLPCHLFKFKKIGFEFYRTVLGDDYYTLPRTGINTQYCVVPAAV